MLETFDLTVLHLFNSWVAYSAKTFYSALFWSNKPSWIIAGCTLVALWFCGKPDAPEGQELSRRQSQRRVILLFMALVLAFVGARVLGVVFERMRPMVDAPLLVPIDPAVWQMILDALKMQGAFPSDHAAMFAVVTVGVFITHRGLGWLALLVNFYFVVLRVGIGFHWPTDMLVGELLGVGVALGLLRLEPLLKPLLDWGLGLFEKYAFIAYPAAFMVMLDFTQKFDGLFTLLAELKEHLTG